MRPGWSEVTVGDVCEFRYGRALKAEDRSGSGWPVYGSNGMVGAHDTALTPGPTIVIGRKGSYGEVHYVDGPVWPIDTTYFVDETCSSCDLKWLAYRLSDLRLTELNKSAAIPGLNRDDAYRVRLLLPPLAEQQRIASVLDAAESVRSARRRTFEALDELRTVMLSCLLRSQPSPTKSFGDLLLGPLGNGLSPSTAGTYPGWVLTLSALSRDGFDQHARKPCLFDRPPAPRQMVKRGTFLVSRGNGNLRLVGAGAVVPADLPGVAFPDTVIGAKLDDTKVDSEYFGAVWNSRVIRAQIERMATTTNGTFKINQRKLAAIEVPLPCMPDQKEFAGTAIRIAAQRRRGEEHLSALDALFSSLQHRAFAGEL